MASGPLDHDTASPTLHSPATSIPRIRNPVVESWNDDDELLSRPAPTNRIPGASPYGAPFATASALRAAPATGEETGPTSAKRLVPPLLVLALFLLGSSSIAIGLAAIPVQPYLITWRYSMVGAISIELISPLIAVTLVTASLLIAERARVTKVVAVAFAVAAVAVIPTLLFFLLDAIQMRSILDSALRGKVFLVAIAKTVMLLTGAMLVLLTNAYVLFRATRQWSKNEFSVDEWHR